MFIAENENGSKRLTSLTVAAALPVGSSVATLSFDGFLRLLRRQRQDLESQMEEADRSHRRTTDLMKSIAELRERVRKTVTSEEARRGA